MNASKKNLPNNQQGSGPGAADPATPSQVFDLLTRALRTRLTRQSELEAEIQEMESLSEAGEDATEPLREELDRIQSELHGIELARLTAYRTMVERHNAAVRPDGRAAGEQTMTNHQAQ